jgi:putative ABC transport system permease protein
MLSRGYFERRFAGDERVLGRTITVGGRQMPVMGVLPRGFRVDLVWRDLSGRMAPEEIDVYEARPVRVLPNGMIQIFQVIGELKPSVSIEAARAELQTIRDRVTRERLNSLYRPILRVLPLKDRIVGEARPALLILLAAVAVVLLVACANLAALLLARASGRQRELAIRAAIGAGRGRMLRQLCAETLLLAVAGATLGLLVSRAFVAVATTLIPGAVPRLIEARTDWRVLLFAIGLALLTALVFGVAPMLSKREARPYDLLKDGLRTVSAATPRVRMRAWLVMGEIALTVTLLCAAGLLVKSLWRLTTYPSGFAPGQTLSMSVPYDGQGRDRDGGRRRQYIHDVLERIAAVPGLEAVGMTTSRSGRLRLLVENAPSLRDDQPAVFHSAVSANYARTIGMRVVRGRWVTDAEPYQVYVLNETAARLAFGDADPVGRRLQIDGPIGATEGEGAKFATIVGVVADLKYSNLARATEAEVFTDYAHAFPSAITFVARVNGDPSAAAPALRSQAVSVDSTQTPSDVRTVEAVLSDSTAPRRFTLVLFVTFAGFALMLALIGVYGVIAYAVSLRTGEIGVRMALGATPRSVIWLVLKQGIAVAFGGLALGLLAAIAVTRFMTALLYETAPVDGLTFAVASLVLLGTALGACSLPALKAARVDPLVALKCE